MNTAYYSQMINYARKCLPVTAFSEPGDLVNDAILKAGYQCPDKLKKAIRDLAYLQLGATNVHTELTEFATKSKVIPETTRVCRCCHQELSIHSYYKRTFKSGVTITLTECKSCHNKISYRSMKTNTAYQAKKKEWLRQNLNKEKKRERYKLFVQQLKADPERYAAYRHKKNEANRRLKAARLHSVQSLTSLSAQP